MISRCDLRVSFAGEAVAEELSGARRESVREDDIEADEEIAASVGVLGQRQPLADDPLDGGRLDNLILEVNQHPFTREQGHLHSGSTQGLQNK